MKKVKHRLVEKMNESTADSLGLSRAVLVNGKSLTTFNMYMKPYIIVLLFICVYCKFGDWDILVAKN